MLNSGIEPAKRRAKKGRLIMCLVLLVAGALLVLCVLSSALASGDLQIPGVRAEFFEQLEAAETHWQDLSTRLPSTSETENYAFLGSVPQVREWKSGRLAKGIRSESYSIESKLYEATVEVDRRALEDDQTGQIRLRLNELAVNAATHKDFLIEQLLIYGESTGLAYDGQAFFSTTHESGGSGAQDNLLTYGAVAPDAPTAAEFRGALCQAIAQMIAFKDDQGQPRRTTPTGLVCVVPPTMLFTAMEAVDVQLVGTGANPLQSNVIQNAASVITLPGLTDASKWYLLKVGGVPVRPFVFQDRVPLEFQAMDIGSEHAFLTDRCLFGVRARYTMTYGYWQLAIRTDFM